MNDALKLTGPFFSRKSPGKPGAPSLPKNAIVNSEKLRIYANQLSNILDDWRASHITSRPLVSVYYERIVAKSSRMQRVMSDPGKNGDQTVVGSKFAESPTGQPRHIVTHCLSEEGLMRSIDDLNTCATILDQEFGASIDEKALKSVNDEASKHYYKQLLDRYGSSRSRFARIIVDVCLVERFGTETEDLSECVGDAIITLYNTGDDLKSTLNSLGVPFERRNVLNGNTVIMTESQYRILADKAAFLIAMSAGIDDWTSRQPEETLDFPTEMSIAPPGNQPTIGVIDALFKDDPDAVYFSDWVESHDLVDPNIDRTPGAYIHGTKVTSIIVDGPSLQPDLQDGCGRFRVRHFGVGVERMSLTTVFRLIPEIVANNTDIKVWNLSLGSSLPISRNSVSPVAAMLDRLQREYDIVFVIAGTNDKSGIPNRNLEIGSPADSINSLVVNSVCRDGTPASYSRKGPVLWFYGKPDVCYFGGDDGEPLRAWAPWGSTGAKGTSYAAPWIARKLAYLIEVIGLTKEAAKALIIDSAARWAKEPNADYKGYGIVPTHIKDILGTADDEIKFIVTGKSTTYDTYTYRIPVPVNKGKYPYYVKATLCYFPKCSRNQGVDYTNTELDLKIGRLKNGRIDPVNNNLQGEPGFIMYEGEARKLFRKWDNVKVVGETIKKRKIPKDVYENEYWGISVKAKERFNFGARDEVAFGIVVTLKEMYGINRIDEFIRRCEFAQWRVSRLSIENSIDIYNVAEQEIEFDE